MAPDCCATGLPCLKTISVGMLRMLKRAEMSGAASVSSLAKRYLGSSRLAADSKCGAMAWQGPHQGAQKSTTTGRSLRPT